MFLHLIATAFAAIVVLTCATARAADAGESFRDCADCPEMVTIPEGSFIMGVPAGEEEREEVPPPIRGSATPQHPVTVPSFALAKYAVTRAEFAQFAEATGRAVDAECWTLRANKEAHPWQYLVPGSGDWRNPGFPQTPNDPVVCVSWNDAVAYVEWLSQRAGRPYRLPSEAEREYATRAGSPAARFWGDDQEEACRYANVADLTAARKRQWQEAKSKVFFCFDGFADTAPVGSFAPNAFGLYDMLGNVDEWVADCWNANYSGAPSDGSAWTRGDCSRRIMRGGAWSGHPWSVRSGYRGWGSAGVHIPICGFRVARSMDPNV